MPSTTSASLRRPTPPVFHPDHPHNRPPLAHTQTSPLMARDLNLHPVALSHSHSYKGQRTPSKREEMSDSDTFSSPSPVSKGRCFCGKDVGQESLYCSVDCARSDAFSSLCYKPASIILPTPPSSQPSLASSISAGLSRNPSTCSSATTSSRASQASYSDEWTASHYRRMAHADMRREERRDERRRRRAEGSIASSTTSRSTSLSSSTSSSRVPDLVGGAGHSRNNSMASTTTSVSSVWSAGLSRNPSSASSASSRRYGAGVHVDTMIMEDDEEEEWLSQPASVASSGKPYGSPGRGHKRRHSKTGASGMSASKQKKLETSFGMGKDMRDVLEEIISMEKEFMLSDGDGDGDGNGDGDEDMTQTQRMEPGGLFTASFAKPPRTPSPVQETRRRVSVLPPAPGGPLHSRHNSGSTASKRPPSLVGLHQSSLSESHTALYLATASPAHARPCAAAGRRSASPALEARRSITFDATAAGPAIASLATHGELPIPRMPGAQPQTRLFDSPASSAMSITPQRRRPQISPHAVHPSMDGWKFPSPAAPGSGALATPTKKGELAPPRMRKTSNDAYTTPQHQRFRPGLPKLAINTAVGASQGMAEQAAPKSATLSELQSEPQLLWPPPPRPLAPALFPCSPANGTPDLLPAVGRPAPVPIEQTGDSQRVVPPSSGLKLGVLLGSGSDVDPNERRHGEDGDDGDVDMDDDDSTAHGHGYAMGIDGSGTGYLPVFLEAEGFRPGWRRG